MVTLIVKTISTIHIVIVCTAPIILYIYIKEKQNEYNNDDCLKSYITRGARRQRDGHRFPDRYYVCLRYVISAETEFGGEISTVTHRTKCRGV